MSVTTPRILVLGSTGLMGREVVRSLNERGVTPRVLVRDPSRLRPTDQVDLRVDLGHRLAAAPVSRQYVLPIHAGSR